MTAVKELEGGVGRACDEMGAKESAPVVKPDVLCLRALGGGCVKIAADVESVCEEG